MAKKMIEQEKKWFVKEPAKLEEILEAAGLLANNELIVKALYADINRIYGLKSYADSFIRKSVIKSHFTKRRRFRVKLLDTVLANKWLFYTQEIEGGSDVLIQPVFDMEKMTERKINSLIKAITNNDYEKVKKLVPNDVAKFDKYSRCLFKEEEVNMDSSDSFHNSLSSAPARDGSELTHQNEQEKAEIRGQRVDHEMDTEWTRNGHGMDTLGTTPIISTRVDAKENRDKRIGDKENKRFNQSKEENRNLSMEEDTGLLSFSDKKTDYETDSGGTLEEYVNGLKLGSKEVESLFDFAGDEAEFFRSNFDKFKLKFINRAKLLNKDKELDGQSRNKKNLYLYNVLRQPAFRKEMVKDIQDCLVFKIQTDFRFHKEGYKHDLFNKDGDRMSGGKIIPRDAPPQPSPEHWWSFKYKQWCL